MPVTNKAAPTVAELEADIAEEEARQKKIRPAMREPQRGSGRLSDAEIMAKYADEYADDFAVPEGIIPAGMVYAWKALDGVLGKPDPAGAARILRAGFSPVPAERHPGQWTQPGAKGNIIHKGLTLCEMPAEEDYNRRRYFYLLARGQVKDKMQQLSESGQGEYRRDHPAVRPRVKRGSFEPIAGGSEIE